VPLILANILKFYFQTKINPDWKRAPYSDQIS